MCEGLRAKAEEVAGAHSPCLRPSPAHAATCTPENSSPAPEHAGLYG